MRDPYKTLGVRRDAGVDEIKAAWRNMAKAVHPDHNLDDPTATERFAEIGRAYDTLKDPKKRSRYDQVLGMAAAKSREQTIMQQRQAQHEAEARAKVARANAEKVMEELARANAQKAQKASNAAAASAAQAQAGSGPQVNAQAGNASAGKSQASTAQGAPANETPEDMVERIFGAQARANAPGAFNTAGNTSGAEQGAGAEKRPGNGYQETTDRPETEDAEPAAASGIGSIISLPPFGIIGSLVRRITGTAPALEKAPEIAAEATVTLEDILKGNWISMTLADGREQRFQAAPGMGDGSVVHLKGQGLKLQGMLRGDVAITVHLSPDDRFTIKGFDLHTTLPVTIENAVLGCRTHVEGLSGSVGVTVPAWSGSDHVIRIPNEGLPNGDGGKGDLVVELRLMLWEKPDDRITDLMRIRKDGLFL